MDAVNARLLPALVGRVPKLLAGGSGPDGITFVDVDDTIREVHGYAKQAAGFGYSGVRGLNAQIATVCTPTAAPVIAAARLRRGNVGSATGTGRLLAQALNTTRAAGVTGQVLARADSAYYGWDFVGTAIRHQVWFSVTARMNPAVVAAISGIGEPAWTTIRYPHAVWDETERRWVSDAEVAEVPFIAFTSRRKAQHVTCRLVVRRVKRLQPKAGGGTVQGELFAAYRYHAFITNSTLDTVTADARHRDHAIVEQVIAELKNGPLAHLPSGKYAANAAWVACAVIAFNLARAAAVAAGMPKARWATLRIRIIGVPARIAVTGRRHVLHLVRKRTQPDVRQLPAEPGRVERSWRSGGGLEGDVVAEGLECADVVAGGSLGAQAGVVEVGSEVVEAGPGFGEQVPDDDQDGPSDGDDGLLLAPSSGYASVTLAEEGVGPTGVDGGLAEGSGEVPVAVAGGPGTLLPPG